MSASDHQFCSIESLRAGDPLAGTGTHVASNLLISWPRPKWSRSLRLAVDMDEELSQQIERLAAGGRRVNLIDRRGWSACSHRIYQLPEGRYFDVDRSDLVAFLAAVESGSDLASWSGTPMKQSLVLCCTHGKKDKCCAKFGYAAYRELAATVNDRDLPFEVWESSHLGGCRLSASVMVFPAMRKYGRVAPEHVLPLLEHEAEGVPYLPCYRGHSQLSQPQQCAEIAALEWLSERRITARLTVETKPDSGKGEAETVRVDWMAADAAGALIVECGTTEVMRVDTCADLDEGPTPSLCWKVNNIRPL
ncbi:sucrase ferredoxin [Marinobacter sp. NP-4(2019)]|uniref:sucrase ferredoxin n=1 Tax=Marinobacter sp. NP-4(2019) TaxID=2488665 RepID=UPI000FC3D532|nr:sucrase ferredoxin [Marinobacter sp. NP-4(2019)]AZT82206.1 sucrase ferredoxin [Marinobacter sp. NP-4(2019)]